MVVLKIFRKRVSGKPETMNIPQVVCVRVLKDLNDTLSRVSLHMYFETKQKYQGSGSCRTLPLVVGLNRPLGVLLSLGSKMEEDAAQRQSKQI